MTAHWNGKFIRQGWRFLEKYPLSFDASPRALRFLDLGGGAFSTRSNWGDSSVSRDADRDDLRAGVGTLPAFDSRPDGVPDLFKKRLLVVEGKQAIDVDTRTVRSVRNPFRQPRNFFTKGPIEKKSVTTQTERSLDGAPVCFCDLCPQLKPPPAQGGERAPRTASVKDLHSDTTERNLLEVRVSGDRPAEGFPIYFLPWRENSTTALTLGSDANHFITASLTGCTVYVTGPVTAPTVFHANGMAVVTEKKIDDRRGQEFMNYMLAVAESELGLDGQGGSTPTPQLLRKKDYRKPGLAYIDGKETKHGDGAVDYLRSKTVTTVVGYRNAGGWRFYYQVWVQLVYTKAGQVREKFKILDTQLLWPSTTRTSISPADLLP